uniref:Uncharacterized protein n=1 Tax=Panagrolaimus superbus TaxID=310955 RepID=A0A914YIG4_9BILA
MVWITVSYLNVLKSSKVLFTEDEGMAQIGSPKHSHEEKSTSKTANFESTEEDISEGSTDDRVESINSTNNVDHDLGFTGNNVLNGSSPEMTQSFLDSYGVAEASIIPAEEELDRPPTPIVPNPEDLAIDKEEAERLAKLDTIRKEVVYLQSKLQKYDQAMDDALKALRKKFVEDKAELKETHALQCSEISATLDERRQQQIELTTSSITRLSEKLKQQMYKIQLLHNVVWFWWKLH